MGLASFTRMRRLKAEQEAKKAETKQDVVAEENTQEEEGLLVETEVLEDGTEVLEDGTEVLEDGTEVLEDGTEEHLNIDPDEVTVKELKAMCDEKGIEYTSKITKPELIEKLEG